MLDFIKENYQLICFVGSIFIELILAIVCVALKNKKDDPVLSIISDMLPSFIKEAELKIGCGKGDEKLSLVLTKVEECYEKLTGVKLHLTGYLYKYFVNRVEAILSAPSKKGN